MWVLIEHRDGEIEEASLEILSEARRLAGKLKRKVAALVLGTSAADFATPLSQYGADNVFCVNHELLKAYTTDGYTAALTALIQSRNPEVFLLAATYLGRDLAPRLATRLRTSLVTDCTVLAVDAAVNLELTRPTCNGRVYVTMSCTSSGPKIATIRPGVLGLGKPLRGRSVNVEELQVDLDPGMIRTRAVEFSRIDADKLDIAEAEVVLAIGRGVTEPSVLRQAEELAGILHASLGGSRAAVDERYLTFERQIGQTGKTIAPKVIVCCGISGAQQFTMGMRDSKFIVAINTDRNAPIFKVADVSILGDLKELLPELLKQMQGPAVAKTP